MEKFEDNVTASGVQLFNDGSGVVRSRPAILTMLHIWNDEPISHRLGISSFPKGNATVHACDEDRTFSY
jgi:hypothetical protein